MKKLISLFKSLLGSYCKECVQRKILLQNKSNVVRPGPSKPPKKAHY